MIFSFSTVFAINYLTAETSDSIYWEVKDYKDVTGGVAPTEEVPDGYLFAGWFTDESCDKETALGQGEHADIAYAKYVPKEILGLKAQINNELWTNDGFENDDAGGAIRFVTSVDSLDYAQVGFIIQKEGSNNPITGQSNQVYTQLFANVGDSNSGYTDKYKPSELFHEKSQFFMTWTIRKIPSQNYGTKIYVTPFWETLDGTIVKASLDESLSYRTVNRLRSWEYVFVDDSGNDGTGAGILDKPYKTLEKALTEMSENKKFQIENGESDAKVGMNGIVYVKETLKPDSETDGIFEWYEHDLDVTIKGYGESCEVDFSKISDMKAESGTQIPDLIVGDDVTFANMTLKFYGVSLETGKAGRVFANGHQFEIAEDVKSYNPYTTIHGGGYSNKNVAETNVTILAGTYRAIYGGGCYDEVTGDTHITLRNTTVYSKSKEDARVHGGSNKGTVHGDTWVKIGAGFNKDVSLDYEDHSHYSAIYGGGYSSGDNVMAVVEGNTHVLFEEKAVDAKVEYVYGGGAKNSTVVKTCNVEFKAGEALSIVGGSYQNGNNSHTFVKMTNGKVMQIFGGNHPVAIESDKDSDKVTEPGTAGNTNVQVLGGTVTRRIYGGCYNDYEEKILVSGTWKSDNAVSGKINVTIGPEAALNQNYKKNGVGADNSICAISRRESNSDTETGIMVVYTENSGSYTKGFKDDHGIFAKGIQYTNYLVTVEEGGTVIAENGVLQIEPTQEDNYVTVTDVTNGFALCAFQGAGEYSLSELTGTDYKEIKVTFGSTEPNESDFAVRNELNGNTSYYASLEDAIAAAEDGTKVVVMGTVKVNSTITVSKSITLTGEDEADITSGEEVTENLFKVEAGTFKIQGTSERQITIDGNKGNLYRNARAIRIESGAACEMDYVTIQDFSYAGSAGAISCGGTLNSRNCIFEGNTATSGTGGAIYASGKVDLESCTFTSNEANTGGGAIHILTSGRVTSRNCTFSRNVMNSTNDSGNGGVIFCEGTYDDTNSSYIENRSTRNAGVIYTTGASAKVTLTGDGENAMFQGNIATLNGNVSYINTGSQVSITGYKFEGDDQKVFIVGTLIFDDIPGAILEKRSAGTLKVAGTANADKITVTPYTYEAGIVILTKDEDVENDVFKAACANIKVTPNGNKDWYISQAGKLAYGDAYVEGYYGTLDDVITTALEKTGDVEVNVLRDATLTKAVIVKGVNLTIKNESGCDVVINRSSNVLIFSVGASASLTLGTIDEKEEGTFAIDDATIGTTTTRIVDNYGTFTLGRNATIQNVTNNQWGSVMITRDGSVTDLYGNVKDNTCEAASGGAILQHGTSGTGKLTIHEGNYSGNKSTMATNAKGDAGGFGSVVRVYAGTLNIQGGTFSDNSTASRGGVLYIASGTTVNILGGTFKGNKAAQGGAIYCEGTLMVKNAIFDENQATGQGGAIYIGGNVTTSEKCTFKYNKASGNGGAINCYTGEYIDKNSSFIENEGAKGGALIVMSDGTATLTGIDENAKFSNNKADNLTIGGTAILVNTKNRVQVTGYTFEGDKTKQTIHLNGASFTIHHKNLNGDFEFTATDGGTDTPME